MTTQMTLSDEQVEELRQVVAKELDNTFLELHRTDTWDFKQRVQHRIDLLKDIIAAIDASRLTTTT